MVDALVSFAIEKLGNVLVDEVAMSVRVTNDIEKLSSTFKSIQAMLEDAESQRLKNKAVKIWLEKIKDVAYDVDDIIDEWTTETLRSQAADEGDVSCFSKNNVRSFLSPVTCFKHVMLRHRIGSRIKEARGRLDDISKEARQLGLSVASGERERVDTVVRQHEIRKRETSSQVDRSSIVGREDDKKKVLDFLLRESSQEVTDVPVVISIVGMGGLGKTTLAQLAYNDEEVKRHFDVKIWVCVSEDFDVKRITKLMIESATGSPCNLEGLDLLQSHLRDILHSKRFLLVLDDIWSEDRRTWDGLRLPFQAGALGSRIVITTRSENVARAMRNTHMCKLEALSDDECWLLFSSEALEHRSTTERSELEEIGWKIVKKCGGVPLAAKTLGSAMQSRTTRSQWELVLESEIWNLVDVMEGILPALLLSYYDLPPALKQCFTYCSIFPKDWEIEKDKIVKLWVAQGFIGSDTSKDMEEIGGGYFDDLLKRSLLQDAVMVDDKIFECKMHDLVHDLAQFVAGNDCSIMKITQRAIFNLNKVRHSSLPFPGPGAFEVTSIPSSFYKVHKLRTLLIFPESELSIYFALRLLKMSEMEKVRSCSVLHNLFHHLRCLRALEMSGTKISRLPRTVRQLKQLRYLDLSDSMIEELPEELIACKNLQSLILNFCRFLKRLPREMRKLISLRHLELRGTELGYLPKGIGRLTSLQTLTDFIVGGNDGCELGELKHLKLLRGLLYISQLQKASSQEEAKQAELNEKMHLHTLILSYSYGEVVGDEEKRRAEVVLQGLQPHTNLKVLKIWHYRGSKFPDWMGDPSFSNLISVELSDCTECEELPPLWNLPMLRELQIVGCPLLKQRYKMGGDDRHKIAHISDLRMS
ncbi:putative disease resistance protein RGA3 [Magnolia sinica]|uniref:putative disease resistance protein RGA3 n=1 Tax=Magnolia sinica TaxID=86752 RepID=UPI002658FE56|nr:putative disease resistance protein RGA3 [Magnolia sinica]